MRAGLPGSRRHGAGRAEATTVVPDRGLTLLQHAKIAVHALFATRIEYAFGGAIAVNAWVRREAVRLTQDIDFHAVVSRSDLVRICEDMGRRGVHGVPGGEVVFRTSGMTLRRILCEPGPIIDFLETYGPHGSQAIARRIAVPLQGRPAYVLAPEDVLLYKALAFRDKDRLDIENVIEAQGPQIDREYLESWARRLRIWTRLSRFLRRA